MRSLLILPLLSFLVAAVTYLTLAPERIEDANLLARAPGNSGSNSLPGGSAGLPGASGVQTSGSVARPQQQEPVQPAFPLPDRNDCAAIKGTTYHSDAEREWYIENCVPKAPPVPVVPAPNPPAVPGPEVTGERWVQVNIAAQTITAMVGNKPLYTALATTGKEGWDTPTGSYNIVYRVANETMTSESIGAEEEYVLKDVLYTQYFTTAGHAIHLNYWRPDYYFGEIASSHGCIGVRLADAEFFWKFLRNGSRVTIV